MRNSGLATRKDAVPYRATPWSSDLYAVFGTKSEPNLASGRIRFTRPHAGEIVTAKLTVLGTAPIGGTTKIRLYKGDFAAGGTLAIGTYSEERIAKDHLALTGLTAPLSFASGSQLIIDGIDVMHLVTQQGDADYNEDGFILGIEVVTVNPTTFLQRAVKLDCTVQMGVL